MPRRFRDSRSWITASTTKALLLCQRIPVAAFSRGAGVLGITPPTPKLNVFMRPLNTSEPHLQLLDGFAGQISPKRHPSSAFPLVGEADREHSPRRKLRRSPELMAKSAPIPRETAQNPQGRNRGQGRGSRKRQRGRSPKHRGGASAGEAAAADAHVAKRILAPDAPQTVARKRL